MSLSARRAWIEIILGVVRFSDITRSLSARRAWIEIVIRTLTGCVYMVALRKESVDRNTNLCPASLYGLPVALRKESVDRNLA